ncbi:MAG: hypothetical protein E4H05_04955, partial [Acidimicrobiales bacterium]
LAANPDQALAFVDDQRGHPTFTADLAPALHRLALDRRVGIHHVTNQGAVSWYEFVREILAAAGHDPDRVRPIATADLDPPRPAPRPANSVLDNAVWRAAGYEPLRDFREPLRGLVAKLAPHRGQTSVWPRAEAHVAKDKEQPRSQRASHPQEFTRPIDAVQCDVVASDRRPVRPIHPESQHVVGFAAPQLAPPCDLLVAE